MTRKASSCALCESTNLPSICARCANTSLRDCRCALGPLRNVRDSLHTKLSNALAAKRRGEEQIDWRVRESEKTRKLKKRLDFLNKRNREEKRKVDEASKEMRLKNELFSSAFATIEKCREDVLGKFNANIIHSHELALMAITSERLQKQAVVIRQICKLFPLQRVNSDEGKDGLRGPYDKICNARLPRSLDPCSVPSDELAASLGYMIQLVNLVVQNLAAPALHSAGFAGSCSCIWQRVSYWDARPSRSKEYKLFIPQIWENSWSDRSISNFDVSIMESVRKSHIGTIQGGSFPGSSASCIETNRELQKGILLLKKSVQCVTAYCCNSLCLDFSSEASTFEAFSKLLAILSSPKELQSARKSLKGVSTRSDEQLSQLDKSTWNVNSRVSSRSLAEGMLISLMPSMHDSTRPSFLDYGYVTKLENTERLDEGWDFVEHPSLLPSP